MAGKDMETWKRYRKVVQLWRIVILSLFFIDLGLGVVYWAIAGDFYGSMRIIMPQSLVIIGTAVASRYLFSVNIFGKMWISPSPSGRRFVFLCALGLYLSAVVALSLASLLLMLTLHMPGTLVLATVGVESALFSVLSYIGLIRLRRNMRLLSETQPNIGGTG